MLIMRCSIITEAAALYVIYLLDWLRHLPCLNLQECRIVSIPKEVTSLFFKINF
jgi:hypothetical protein